MASTDTSIKNPVPVIEIGSMSRVGNRIALGALLLLCAVALFVKLGAPALFEPDEGRNAEKAREILLLHDWITPHENFAVVLDKPIFYYWLGRHPTARLVFPNGRLACRRHWPAWVVSPWHFSSRGDSSGFGKAFGAALFS